jgi:hypothetical protein
MQVFYCDSINLTGSTTDDADATTTTLTLNSSARRILFVGALHVDGTHTVAEGRNTNIFVTGDQVPTPRSLIPAGTHRSGSLVGGDAVSGGTGTDIFYPVNWKASGNAVLTIGERGIGGTAAELSTVFIWYSDGEGHPDLPYYSHGLRAPPAFIISTDDTAITGSTTETAMAAITVPPNARQCVGLSCVGVADGTITAAEQARNRVRWTAPAAAGVVFEPAQVWPVDSRDAGLQGLTAASVDATSYLVEFLPLMFPVVANGTITGNVTMADSVSGATQFRPYAAFL